MAVHRGLSFDVDHVIYGKHRTLAAWLREEGDRVFFDEHYLGDSQGDFPTAKLVTALEMVLVANNDSPVTIEEDQEIEDAGYKPSTLHRDNNGDIVYTHVCGESRIIAREDAEQLLQHLRSWLTTDASEAGAGVQSNAEAAEDAAQE